MLEMRSHCERCAAMLPADTKGAWICSFECTYCAACAGGALGGVCPNCGGQLCARPTRVPRGGSAGPVATAARAIVPASDQETP